MCLPEGGLGMLGMECTPIPVKTHQLAQSRAHFNTTKHTPKLAQSIAQRVPRWAGWGLGWVGHTLGWNDVILINLTPGAVGLRGWGGLLKTTHAQVGAAGRGDNTASGHSPSRGRRIPRVLLLLLFVSIVMTTIISHLRSVVVLIVAANIIIIILSSTMTIIIVASMGSASKDLGLAQHGNGE